MEDIKWITRGGKHIPLTNEYMNDKIRNSKAKIVEKKDKDFKNYYTMQYKQGKEELGHLEYQNNNGNITINMIRTNDKYQRQGVATKLLQELKKKHGDKIYKFSAVLEDGEKLLKSKTNIVRVEDGNYYVKIK